MLTLPVSKRGPIRAGHRDQDGKAVHFYLKSDMYRKSVTTVSY